MAERFTVEHGGSSVTDALINKLKSIGRNLNPKSNDSACIPPFRHNSRSKQIEAELLVLICCIFPHDFRIPIQDLVACWMSLDLSEDVHGMFSTRCRIHDIISTVNDKQYPRKVIGGRIGLALGIDGPLDRYVRILVGSHDIEKLITSSSPFIFHREIVIGKWLEANWCEDCYGLSLVLKKVDEHPINLEFPKLTLLRLQSREDSQSIPVHFFDNMKELRVLSLDLQSLPHSLGMLKNLKTLCLKVQRIEGMSWIGNLISLEFLTISVLTSTDIPRELGKLENLRLLDLRKMNIAYIPPGVLSRLLKLEELYLPLNFTRWACRARKYDDYDEWESVEEDDCEREARCNGNNDEADYGGKTNASLSDLVSLPLNALQICVPEASFLPRKSPIFKSIQEFNICTPDNALYQPFGKYSRNVLQLTGEAFDIKVSGICDLLSKAEELSLTRVRNLRNVIHQLEGNGFPQLMKMIISECNELEFVVGTTRTEILSEVGHCFLWKLECLHLSMLSNLKEICHKRWTNLIWFSNLTHVSIRFCPKLTYVFPLSIVRGLTLKSIEVLGCYAMEGIFYEDEDSIPQTHGSIEKLELYSLPRLISFLVPKDDEIDGAENGINQSLTTNEVSVMKKKDIASQMETEMYGLFSSRFIVRGFQKLETLKISFCDLVKVVFFFEETHATSKAFNSLEVLELHGLRNLVHIWFQIPPKMTTFKNLKLLIVSECGCSYLFSYRIAKLLVQLQKVYVSRCEKMESMIIGNDVENEEKGRIVLPRLKLLELQHMPNLEILFGTCSEMELPALESLRLKECRKMKPLSDGLLKMPMLKGIEVNGSLISLTKDQNLIFTGVAAPHKFTYSDLKKATKNFSSDNILEVGGFAKVFKGWIDTKTLAPSITSRGMLVAVKRYMKVNSSRLDVNRMAHVERDVLESRSHPNLVKLLGCCLDEKESALVYELVPGGNLHHHLSSNPGIKPLPWDVRVKIAIGVAQGLNYLHTSEPKVIHRDIKPHNILLDNDYNSKLADFGLAIWGPSDGDLHETSMKCNAKICDFALAKVTCLGESEATMSCAAGTVGYIAPENVYPELGRLSVKSDVYSFGVVLLVLVTGLEVYQLLEKFLEREEVEEKEAPNLFEMLKLRNRELKDIVDPRIEGEYSKAILLMLELASKCTERHTGLRPTMGEVLEKLHEIDAIQQKSDQPCK